MIYKKLFFPIGGGDELKERIHGALLIGKHFKAHVEIFQSLAQPSQIMQIDDNLPATILKELNAVAYARQEENMYIHQSIFEDEIKKVGNTISKTPRDEESTAAIVVGNGYRSKLIEEESKFCDLVIVASPPKGRITATFETTITKSGKPALMFPRVMKKFSTKKIIIGWNNSPEVSRAVSQAIPILKNAEKVHIVTSIEYMKDINQIVKLQGYLSCHGIKSSYEIVKTTRTPGQALLNNANDGDFDLIIAGAFGHKGLRELMFGGTTKYILENTKIPIFMSH